MKIAEGIGFTGIFLSGVLSVIFYVLGYGTYGERSVIFGVIFFTIFSIPMLKKQFYTAAIGAWVFFEIIFRIFNPYWSYNSLTGSTPTHKKVIEHLNKRDKFEVRGVVYIRTHFYYADSYSYQEMLNDALAETKKEALDFFNSNFFGFKILKQNKNLNQELISIESFMAIGKVK